MAGSALAVGLAFAAPGAGAAEVVADNGFRTADDGFSFPNYGPVILAPDDGEVGEGTPERGAGLAGDELQGMFGRAVCTTLSGRCTLTPMASEWAAEVNASSNGGHCYGFAVLSSAARAQTGWKPASYGGARVPDLRISRNRPLQRLLTAGFAHQFLDRVGAVAVRDTPRGILQELERRLERGAQAMFAIYKDDGTGGHAITPYAVEGLGGGAVDVMVYDNNFPGQERRVRIDTAANTWQYSASTNPSEPEGLYRGDASTGNLQIYDPLAGFRGGPHAFPPGRRGQAQEGGSDDAPQQVLTWTGDPTDGEHGSLVIRDPRGRTSGCVHDGEGLRCIDRIPGTEEDWPLLDDPEGHDESPHPRYSLAETSRYRVTMSGVGLAGPAREELSIMGDDYMLGVERVDLRPGERDRITVEPRGRGIGFEAGGRAEKDLRLELAAKRAAVHHSLAIRVARVPARASVRAQIHRGPGILTLASTSNRPLVVSLDRLAVRGPRRAVAAPTRIVVPARGSIGVEYATPGGRG